MCDIFNLYLKQKQKISEPGVLETTITRAYSAECHDRLCFVHSDFWIYLNNESNQRKVILLKSQYKYYSAKKECVLKKK